MQCKLAIVPPIHAQYSASTDRFYLGENVLFFRLILLYLTVEDLIVSFDEASLRDVR